MLLKEKLDLVVSQGTVSQGGERPLYCELRAWFSRRGSDVGRVEEPRPGRDGVRPSTLRADQIDWGPYKLSRFHEPFEIVRTLP